MEKSIFSLIDVKVSGGPEIIDNSSVLLLYKIALSTDELDKGKYIESTYSPDIPIRVVVNTETLLLGIYKGLIGMHGGGSVRRIVVPPNLGYGEKGYGHIKPNTTLFVELCVVSVDP